MLVRTVVWVVWTIGVPSLTRFSAAGSVLGSHIVSSSLGALTFLLGCMEKKCFLIGVENKEATRNRYEAAFGWYLFLDLFYSSKHHIPT